MGYDTAILVLTLICAVGAIITSIPVVKAWFESTVSAAIESSKVKWLTLAISTLALLVSLLGLYRVSAKQTTEEFYNLKQETVMNKTFREETIELDGKYFTNCTFGNGVEFLYKGRAPFSIVHSNFSNPWGVQIRTTNGAAFALTKLVNEIRIMSKETVNISVSLVDESGKIIP